MTLLLVQPKDQGNGGMIHPVVVLRAELPVQLGSRPVVQGKVCILRRRVGYIKL